MAFIDSEKAFDRVPWEVVLWALRYLGVDEWIVSVIKAMYDDARTKVRVNESEREREREKERKRKASSVRMEVYWGSVFTSLLFIIVLEVLSSVQRGLAYTRICFTQMILFL